MLAATGQAGVVKRHLDINSTALLDDELVDQPELDEVHRDFRVADGLQGFQHRPHQRQIVFASLGSLDFVIGAGGSAKSQRDRAPYCTPSLPSCRHRP